MQTTVEPEPEFVKPALHTHLTAFVVGSCVQVAFESHPPLLTWQLSETSVMKGKNEYWLLPKGFM